MRHCAKCNDPVPLKLVIGDKLHNLQRRKFCLKCSPFMAHNTRNIIGPPQSIIRDGKRVRLRKTADYVAKFRDRKKQKMIEYKGGKCQGCDYDRCPQSLHFHHIDPSQKSFNVSARPSWGFEILKKELDKCVLVCANCHGEIHAGLKVVKDNKVLDNSNGQRG